MYLDERSHELADATIQSHRYRLKQFVQWCDQEDIENLNNLSGRDVHGFRVKRRNEDDLATATMKGQLATLRVFLRFCATIDAVEPGLDEKTSSRRPRRMTLVKSYWMLRGHRRCLITSRSISTQHWSTYSSRFSGIRAFESGPPSGLASRTMTPMNSFSNSHTGQNISRQN